MDAPHTLDGDEHVAGWRANVHRVQRRIVVDCDVSQQRRLQQRGLRDVQTMRNCNRTWQLLHFYAKHYKLSSNYAHVGVPTRGWSKLKRTTAMYMYIVGEQARA